MNAGTSRKILFLLTISILTGALLGGVLEVLHPDWQIWQNEVFRQGMGLSGKGFHEMLIQYTYDSMIWLVILAILGLSVFGVPTAVLTLMLRGSAIGAILAELYRNNGFAGVMTVLLFIMPYVLTSTGIMMLSARETVRSTHVLIACISGKETEKIPLGIYCLRWLVLTIAMFLLTLLQCAWLSYGYPAFLRLAIRE